VGSFLHFLSHWFVSLCVTLKHVQIQEPWILLSSRAHPVFILFSRICTAILCLFILFQVYLAINLLSYRGKKSDSVFNMYKLKWEELACLWLFKNMVHFSICLWDFQEFLMVFLIRFRYFVLNMCLVFNFILRLLQMRCLGEGSSLVRFWDKWYAHFIKTNLSLLC
jgi:hypothetical protein